MTELVFILDKSGSMEGLESDTIGGFNSVLNREKEEDDSGLLTTVLFDDRYDIIHDRLKIKDIKPLTKKEYYVGGSTALLDAIGKTIKKVEDAQDKKPTATLVTIITDGQENASHEYSYEHIKELIYRKERHDNWKFVFLGANIDTFEVASKMGVNLSNSHSYVSDDSGIGAVYSSLSKSIRRCKIRSTESMDSCEMDFSDIDEDNSRR